jgi:WD40 repeat protein
LIVGEYSGTLRLFRLESQPKEVPLERSEGLGVMSTLAFAPSGRYLAVILHNRSILVWDTETGRLHATLRFGVTRPTGLAVTGDGARVFTAEPSGRLAVWDSATSTLLGSVQIGKPAAGVELEMDALGRNLLVHFSRGSDRSDTLRMIRLAD